MACQTCKLERGHASNCYAPSRTKFTFETRPDGAILARFYPTGGGATLFVLHDPSVAVRWMNRVTNRNGLGIPYIYNAKMDALVVRGEYRGILPDVEDSYLLFSAYIDERA